jgi:azurin
MGNLARIWVLAVVSVFVVSLPAFSAAPIPDEAEVTCGASVRIKTTSKFNPEDSGLVDELCKKVAYECEYTLMLESSKPGRNCNLSRKSESSGKVVLGECASVKTTVRFSDLPRDVIDSALALGKSMKSRAVALDRNENSPSAEKGSHKDIKKAEAGLNKALSDFKKTSEEFARKRCRQLSGSYCKEDGDCVLNLNQDALEKTVNSSGAGVKGEFNGYKGQ